MFSQLGDRLKETFRDLRGRGRLSEDNISQALREVRLALLEADVALPVVKSFLDGVQQRALGEKVLESLTPCLLYTSPSPRDQRGSRMPSSA